MGLFSLKNLYIENKSEIEIFSSQQKHAGAFWELQTVGIAVKNGFRSGLGEFSTIELWKL